MYYYSDDIKDSRSEKKTIEVSESTCLSPDYDETCQTRGLAVIVQNFNPKCPDTENYNGQCNELMELLQSYQYDFDIFEDQIHEHLSKEDLYNLCSSGEYI